MQVWDHRYLRDLPALVVAPKQCHVGGVPCFQQHEHGEDLEAVVTPVNKVAHEDVVSGRDDAPGLKQPHEVMELPMDVATHLHGAAGYQIRPCC